MFLYFQDLVNACERLELTLKETTEEIVIRVLNPVAHVFLGSSLKMRNFKKLY